MTSRSILLSLAAIAAAALPARADIIADSVAEFSNVQGAEGWINGYRDVTADGNGPDGYNADTDFIAFAVTQWDGGGYRIGGNPPWTRLGAESAHPNGTNNAVDHWVIRRWVAEEITAVTPVAIQWHLRKGDGATGGGGTTVRLYQNGTLRDQGVVAGDDTFGIEHTYYLNVLPGQRIDLVLTCYDENGATLDGSDTSVFTMLVDDSIPANPRQPDGTPFEPAAAGDSDGDGIPDAWEFGYFPGDLTQLSATGDKDGDGLLDPLEYTRGSDPTKPDTDGDGLGDLVETNTGVFVSASDTGTSPVLADTDGDSISDADEIAGTPQTDPTKADTDDDGSSDSDEFLFGSDPLDGDDTPLTFVIADSVGEFSGVQGQDGWEYGVRDFFETGRTANYDPATAFKRFNGGSDDPAEWEEGADSPQQWNGSQWDIASANPWTEIGPENVHPNSFNNDGLHHWAIRRWRASELTEPTAVNLTWKIRKTNPAGDGVTGAIHVNGNLLDSLTIAGNDSIGSVRKVFTVLNPGDIVDLVLTPSGVSDSFDGSDGSAQWLRVDTRIPANARQPDGAPFFPPGSPDTDGDGLADAWEELYAPGNLAALDGTGNNDDDNLTNAQEQALGTDPTKGDTDGDTLKDHVETFTGVFVGPNDTGSNPRLADSDQDGLRDDAEALALTYKTNPMLADTDGDLYHDGLELRNVSDPTLDTNTPNSEGIANSRTQFSGFQGEGSWFYGYRDLKADGGEFGDPYDAQEGFIPFPGGDGEGDWDGFDQVWDVNTWHFGRPPWTTLTVDQSHPNGPANADWHWSVRRWVATGITGPTPLAIRWRLAKTNLSCGDGVSSHLFINGVMVDTAAIPFDDGVGIGHVYFAVISPGDLVDLVHDWVGPDGGEGNDGCDGSLSWMRIDEDVPDPAYQPDGTPFNAGPPADPAFRISSIARDAGSGNVTLTFPSESGAVYDVHWTESTAAGGWARLTSDAGLAGTGGSVTFTDSTVAPAQPLKTRVFYRVSKR